MAEGGGRKYVANDPDSNSMYDLTKMLKAINVYEYNIRPQILREYYDPGNYAMGKLLGMEGYNEEELRAKEQQKVEERVNQKTNKQKASAVGDALADPRDKEAWSDSRLQAQIDNRVRQNLLQERIRALNTPDVQTYFSDAPVTEVDRLNKMINDLADVGWRSYVGAVSEESKQGMKNGQVISDKGDKFAVGSLNPNSTFFTDENGTVISEDWENEMYRAAEQLINQKKLMIAKQNPLFWEDRNKKMDFGDIYDAVTSTGSLICGVTALVTMGTGAAICATVFAAAQGIQDIVEGIKHLANGEYGDAGFSLLETILDFIPTAKMLGANSKALTNIFKNPRVAAKAKVFLKEIGSLDDFGFGKGKKLGSMELMATFMDGAHAVYQTNNLIDTISDPDIPQLQKVKSEKFTSALSIVLNDAESDNIWTLEDFKNAIKRRGGDYLNDVVVLAQAKKKEQAIKQSIAKKRNTNLEEVVVTPEDEAQEQQNVQNVKDYTRLHQHDFQHASQFGWRPMTKEEVAITNTGFGNSN